ncbi:MAG: SRPBCC domain-containing protein, partial [Candidatus Limnocylindrales bacterium]
TAHELRAGGRVAYHMTGPEGETYPGYWVVQEVDPPHGLVFKDGFIGEDGEPDDEMPTTVTHIRISDLGNGRTRMVLTGHVPDQAAMDALLEMGADEGFSSAIGQIDAILAEDAPA